MGFGTYRLKGDDAYNATRHALVNGYEWIDTAPLYGNLDMIGRAITRSGISRKSFKITTKISRDVLKSLDYELMVESFFDSLKNLNVDYVDELILHEPIDPLRNWENLCRLYDCEARGLIGRIGVSNFDQESLEQIIDLATVPSVNQIEINPFLTRDTLPDFCKSHGIEIVAHTPLAKGEKFMDPTLRIMASKYSATCPQLMLRWGQQNGYRVIPRSKVASHIEDNLMTRFNISDDDMKLISGLNCGFATHPKFIKKI
jgi:2,5-diketo-D-gluconate reductase B